MLHTKGRTGGREGGAAAVRRGGCVWGNVIRVALDVSDDVVVGGDGGGERGRSKKRERGREAGQECKGA